MSGVIRISLTPRRLLLQVASVTVSVSVSVGGDMQSCVSVGGVWCLASGTGGHVCVCACAARSCHLFPFLLSLSRSLTSSSLSISLGCPTFGGKQGHASPQQQLHVQTDMADKE